MNLCMQSKEIPQSTNRDSAQIKRNKHCVSLGDLTAALLLVLSGIVLCCYAHYPHSTHYWAFWMLLLKDKELLGRQIGVGFGHLY